jgi:hypothetical protein
MDRVNGVDGMKDLLLQSLRCPAPINSSKLSCVARIAVAHKLLVRLNAKASEVRQQSVPLQLSCSVSQQP